MTLGTSPDMSLRATWREGWLSLETSEGQLLWETAAGPTVIAWAPGLFAWEGTRVGREAYSTLIVSTTTWETVHIAESQLLRFKSCIIRDAIVLQDGLAVEIAYMGGSGQFLRHYLGGCTPWSIWVFGDAAVVESAPWSFEQRWSYTCCIPGSARELSLPGHRVTVKQLSDGEYVSAPENTAAHPFLGGVSAAVSRGWLKLHLGGDLRVCKRVSALPDRSFDSCSWLSDGSGVVLWHCACLSPSSTHTLVTFGGGLA